MKNNVYLKALNSRDLMQKSNQLKKTQINQEITQWKKLFNKIRIKNR